MPVYEYKCTVCEERFEVEQSIRDATLETIPGDDHEHTVKKVFHAPGIAFKGDGFYKNDARKASKTAKASGSGDSGSSSQSSGDTTKTEGSSTSSDPSPTKTSTSSSSGSD